MNPIPMINFRNFAPPQLEPVFDSQSIFFLFANVLTMGVYGAADILERQFRIKKLEADQENLLNEAAELMEEWQGLQGEFENLKFAIEGFGSKKWKF